MEIEVKKIKFSRDQVIADLINQISALREKVHKFEIRLYKKEIESLSDEFLGYEYSDRIGCENGEFEHYMYHKGRGFIEEKLMEQYEDNLQTKG